MLLDHLGHPDEAKRVEAAVAADLSSRSGAQRTTAQIGDALATAL
jgi:3-isopropylmalate dehydrogenase